MRHPDDIRFEAQAKHISRLDKAVRELHAERDRLKELEPYAVFYKDLQKRILADEAVMSAWKRFLFVVKLADPDEERYNQAE
jgi:hypothetical protein